MTSTEYFKSQSVEYRKQIVENMLIGICYKHRTCGTCPLCGDRHTDSCVLKMIIEVLGVEK